MSNIRDDKWINTYTGRKFYPLNPTFESLDIRDMAHALSFICRFAGHTKVFYSVAQHCIIMSQWFERRKRLEEAAWALVHEPEEPYMGDMPRPIKYLKQMNSYRFIGKGIQDAWFRKLGLLGEPPATIKELDMRIVVAEARALLNMHPENRMSKELAEINTSDLVIRPYKNLITAERKFLSQYEKLFGDKVVQSA